MYFYHENTEDGVTHVLSRGWDDSLNQYGEKKIATILDEVHAQALVQLLSQKYEESGEYEEAVNVSLEEAQTLWGNETELGFVTHVETIPEADSIWDTHQHTQ